MSSNQPPLFDQEKLPSNNEDALNRETDIALDIAESAKRAQTLIEAPEQQELLPEVAGTVDPVSTNEKGPNYTARRVGAAAAGVALVGGAALGISEVAEKHNTHETIAESVFTIPQGSNVINEAQTTIDEMLEREGLDPNTIRNDQIVYESQEAVSEADGDVTMPGDQFEVELKKNGFGAHSVDIKPVDGQTSPTDLPSDLG